MSAWSKPFPVRSASRLAAAMAAIAAAGPAAAQAPTFLLMPQQLGGNNAAWVAGISDDGVTIAGYGSCTACSLTWQPFVWSGTGNPTLIGRPGGYTNAAVDGFSGDGSTVIGTASGGPSPNTDIGWTWTAAGGFAVLVAPPGSRTGLLDPAGISTDASVIAVRRSVAADPNVNGGYEWGGAARWVNGVVTQLPPLTYLNNGNVYIRSNKPQGVSRDGSTVFAWNNNLGRAVKWVGVGQPQVLPLLAGSPEQSGSHPYAASADGTIIVGIEWAPDGVPLEYRTLAVRWRAGFPAEELPNLNTSATRQMTPAACSADGNTVVGTYGSSGAGSSSRGFFWTADRGTQDLRTLALALGATIPSGTSILRPQAVTPDGLVIAGRTEDNRAFILNLRGAAVQIGSQPDDRQTCPGGSVMLSVAATAGGTVTYQWQGEINQLPGTWINISDGPLLGIGDFSGTGAATMTISNATANAAGRYRCIVSNPLGSITSEPALVTICPADINCSGDLSVQDIFDFLAAYFASAPAGDFNGVNGHTVQDIFDFLAAYFAGC